MRTLAWTLMLGCLTAAVPANLYADEARIAFYAIPSRVYFGEPMLLEFWAQDPDAPGRPLPGFSGSDVLISGFRHDGAAWVPAFVPFGVVVSESLTTEFAVAFEHESLVKIVVSSSMADSAELIAECVMPEAVATQCAVLATELSDNVCIVAGSSLCFSAQVGNYDFTAGQMVEWLDYSGPVYLQYFAPSGLGAWQTTSVALEAVDGQITVNVHMTSVAHAGLRLWIDPQDWADRNFAGAPPSAEKWVHVIASSPAYVSVLLSDMQAAASGQNWNMEQLAHVAILDIWGNHCNVEDDSSLTLQMACEESQIDAITAAPDFSRLPLPDSDPTEGTFPEPQGCGSRCRDARQSRETHRTGALNTGLCSMLTPALVTFAFRWPARSSYYTSLGLPVHLSLTLSAPASGVAHISVLGGVLFQPSSGILALAPASPALLPQAGTAIAVTNTIDAKAVRTSASVAIYEDLGRYVSYKPAAVTTWHHGGAVYSYSAIPDWYYPSELPHRGSPSTAHNTYRDSTHTGIVDNGELIDHLLYQGVRERASRAVRAEVTYDATKLGAQPLQVTWDVSLEYHVLQYGFHNSLAGGYSHSGGAIEMFVSGNLANKRIEAKAGVDKNNALAASSVTVGVGPLSIPIPIPQTTGNDSDGSRFAQPGTLIYTDTGANTLFTVGVISGQVHRAKSNGGWFQYETDHGIGSNLTSSRIDVTIKIGGAPSFVLGTIKFAP